MPFYRKKPVVIEAQLFNGDANVQLIEWCKGVGVGNTIEIPTLEGTMTASPGDFIIKGVNGEFYPCKPDVFHKTYEKM